jgi:AAA+ superfamily predicted ATPase
MKVRTLVGPLSKGMGGEGIMQILTSAPRGYRSGIVAERIEDWPSVMARLARQTFDVLIAEFDETCAPSIDSLFLIQPTLSIIELDLVSRTTKVHVLDVGSEMLMALAHFLAKWVDLAIDEPAETALAAIPSGPAPARRPSAGRLVHQYAEPYRDSAEQFEDLREWLDLKLSLAVARAQPEGNHDEQGGLGRARRALGERAAALGLTELRSAWEEADERLAERTEATDPARPLPLRDLERGFGLDEVERQMLRLALAPDIHASYAQLYGLLQDNLAQPRPTPSLLAELIDEAGTPWSISSRLAGERPFARYGLVAADPAVAAAVPASQIPIAVPADLVDYLLSGDGKAGPGGCRLVDPSGRGRGEPDPVAAPAIAALRSAEGAGAPVVHLVAPPGEEAWLGEQLAAAGRAVVIGSLPRGLAVAQLQEKALAWSRWARLNEAALIISGLDEVDEAALPLFAEWLVRTLAPLAALLVLHGRRLHPVALGATATGIVQIRRGVPSRQERAALWVRAAADRGIALPPDTARDLAATYAFGRAQVGAAVALAAGGGVNLSGPAVGGALREAALQVSRASAPASVSRIETNLGWDDIVLPQSVKDELRSISAHSRHAERVWDDWGFGGRIPYGQGIAALFAGPSGTGKTMAAQIIAREMGAALFQVDLSKTVSKYIGETEKALDGIFDAAEAAGAILEFGEADALFGKRSEVKDSHDRYANVEVSYLLQRIESYRGIALLTTNLKQNLDTAFLRRLRFIIDFPLPDAEQRLAIWTRMFPADAPLAADVDLAILARQLPLSGGSIEKSVLNAAFKAAESGGCIEMSHIVAATRRELAKLGMENAARSLTRLVTGEPKAGTGA